MNKLDKLNRLIYYYQCKLADDEASGKGFKEASKLLHDTIKERKDYIAELVNRDEPMKPMLDENNNHRCARCHHIVDNHYCSDCGGAVDWGKEND